MLVGQFLYLFAAVLVTCIQACRRATRPPNNRQMVGVPIRAGEVELFLQIARQAAVELAGGLYVAVSYTHLTLPTNREV